GLRGAPARAVGGRGRARSRGGTPRGVGPVRPGRPGAARGRRAIGGREGVALDRRDARDRGDAPCRGAAGRVPRRRRGRVRAPVRYASVYPLLTTRALARPFTYAVGAEVERGSVLQVRFGGGRQRGVVVDVADDPPPGIDAAEAERVVE